MAVPQRDILDRAVHLFSPMRLLAWVNGMVHLIPSLLPSAALRSVEVSSHEPQAWEVDVSCDFQKHPLYLGLLRRWSLSPVSKKREESHAPPPREISPSKDQKQVHRGSLELDWVEGSLFNVCGCLLPLTFPFFFPRISLTRSGVSSFHRKSNTPLTSRGFCCWFHTDPWDSDAHSCCLTTQTGKVPSGCALRCQPCWLVFGEWEMGEWQWNAAGEERQ